MFKIEIVDKIVQEHASYVKNIIYCNRLISYIIKCVFNLVHNYILILYYILLKEKIIIIRTLN